MSHWEIQANILIRQVLFKETKVVRLLLLTAVSFSFQCCYNFLCYEKYKQLSIFQKYTLTLMIKVTSKYVNRKKISFNTQARGRDKLMKSRFLLLTRKVRLKPCKRLKNKTCKRNEPQLQAGLLLSILIIPKMPADPTQPLWLLPKQHRNSQVKFQEQS